LLLKPRRVAIESAAATPKASFLIHNDSGKILKQELKRMLKIHPFGETLSVRIDFSSTPWVFSPNK